MTPGWYEVTAKIGYKATGNDITDWDMLNASAKNTDKKWLKEFVKERQKHFITALYFDGLVNVTYLGVKKDVHNQWLVQGWDTMPTRINHTIRLCKLWAVPS